MTTKIRFIRTIDHSMFLIKMIRSFIPLLLLAGLVEIGNTQNCTAAFTFLDDGLTIEFTDESTSGAGDPITSWSWDFDDGTNSSQQHPVHTFPDADNYDVCLTIQTQSGCQSQVCIEIEICTLIMSTNVGPNCNPDGEIEVDVTISDPFDAAREIDVFVDGELLPGSPFDIDDVAPVILTIFLPGDGLTHTILAQSNDVGHCNVSTDITTQDCNSNCFLSGMQVQIINTTTHIVEVVDNFFSPDNITVFAGDIVEFQWVDGGHSSTSDATSGPDSWNSGVQGAGFVYPVQITNPGVHPYYCIPHGGPGGAGMSGVIVANCPQSGDFDIEISFQTTVADPAGFNLLIDGVVQPGSPFPYQGTGQNTLQYTIAGDGASHTVEIQDVADPACIISNMFTSPDCGAAPSCSITLTASQAGPCDINDNIPYELTIQAINGGQSGFQVFVDGVQQGGNFNYDPSGTTVITVNVPGDGQNHEILVADIEDNTCSDLQVVTTQNCTLQCSIINLTATTGSSNIIPVEVADFEFIPQHITITSGDIVEFAWVGQVEHTSTSDATSGPDSWDSGLLGNGATFQTPVLSEGVHPYYCIPHGGPGGVGMSGTITVQADCANDQVAVAISFDAEGTGFNGFNVYVDGILALGSPFPYDPTGSNNIVVNAPGDGQNHTIEVRDVDDPGCAASTNLVTPDCNASTCQLTVDAVTTGSCDANGFINVQLTIQDVNGSTSGFRVRIDGEITGGSPYVYDPSGTTIVDELVIGDGQQHTILIEDLEDGTCSAADNILIPDCSLTCQIYDLETVAAPSTKHIVEVRDFEFFPKDIVINVGDTVEWVWVGAVAHTSTSDAESGPDSWDSGLLEEGATFQVVIQNAGVHPYYCIPHGGPGGVGMSGTITAMDACENNMVAVNIQFSVSGTGQTGFWIEVDGENSTQEPIPYQAGTVQHAQVFVPGDGEIHIIRVIDADDPTCLAMLDVITEDCNAVNCMMDLSASSTGCNENGEDVVSLTIDHVGQGNQGFQLIVDGIAYPGSPFQYAQGNSTMLNIALPGDGNAHQIFIFDVEHVSCSAELTLESLNCTATCSNTDFTFDIARNQTHLVEVRDFEFVPGELDIFIGDTVRFIWTGEVEHTSTSDATTGTDVWNSGLLGQGAIFDVVIQDTGLHRYYCIPHGGPGGIGMAGSIRASEICSEGSFPAKICFTNNNGSFAGFEVYLDGSPLTTSPQPYGPGQETCFYTILPGDAAAHTIEIVDAIDEGCSLDTSFVFPDCEDVCFGYTASFSIVPDHQTLEVSFQEDVPPGSDLMWDFGDGTSSTEQAPVHHYDTAGLYTACLAISNADGCSDTLCREIFVGEFVCSPLFHYENTGLYVQFRDSSTTSIPIENHIWTFGDGSAAEGIANPAHQYESLGIYDVCLTIKADSCLSTTCQTLDLSSQCLVTTAAFDIEDMGDGKFRFINQSSGNITSYLWGFGDGTVSSEANPTHQYTGSGLFTVCLLILDSENSCSDYRCMEVNVVTTGLITPTYDPDQIKVYPNPVKTGAVYLNLVGWKSNDIGKRYSIQVINTQGLLLHSWSGIVETKTSIQESPELPTGTYFLMITTDVNRYSGRLIVL